MRILLLALALSACATMEEEPATPVPDDACGASRVANLVGRNRRDVLDEIGRSGARQIRFIMPGQAVTMDYRADRLNVRLDAGERIVRFDCG